MKNKHLNYLVNTLMFILMMTILGVGFLMKFILISGQERWIKYGRNVELTFWGIDRHEWGKIHLILGLTMIALLILHLILHWNAITIYIKKLFIHRTLRISVVTIFIVVSSLLVISPFLVNVQMAELEYGFGRWQLNESKTVPDTSSTVSSDIIKQPENNQAITSEPQDSHTYVQPHREFRHQELRSEIEVKGYMTLLEVSERYHVSADSIKKKLNIPLEIPDKERLGRLRQWYGFTMSDVREIIYSYRAE